MTPHDPMAAEAEHDTEIRNAPTHVATCPYCREPFIQREETDPAIMELHEERGEEGPARYPHYCLRERCRPVDRFIREAEAEEYRRTAPIREIASTVINRVMMYTELCQNRAPDAILDGQRQMIEKALQTLFRRHGGNRGVEGRPLPDEDDLPSGR